MSNIIDIMTTRRPAAFGADSGEKHEPAGDIDTAVVDSLKALDPNRPIREADIIATASGGLLCSARSDMMLDPMS